MKWTNTQTSVLASYPGESYFVMTWKVKFIFGTRILLRWLHEREVAVGRPGSGWRQLTVPSSAAPAAGGWLFFQPQLCLRL